MRARAAMVMPAVLAVVAALGMTGCDADPSADDSRGVLDDRAVEVDRLAEAVRPEVQKVVGEAAGGGQSSWSLCEALDDAIHYRSHTTYDPPAEASSAESRLTTTLEGLGWQPVEDAGSLSFEQDDVTLDVEINDFQVVVDLESECVDVDDDVAEDYQQRPVEELPT